MNRMDGMVGYYLAPTNWMWELAGFLVVTGVAIFVVNWMLRKILRVERKKFFSDSSNYVNDRHQKVDGYFRWGGAAISLVALFTFFEQGPWVPLAVMMVIGGIQELFTAHMEKKHSDNPNDYKFTLIQMPTGLVIVFTCAVAFFPEFIEIFFKDD
ncbi:DUF4181 domain-containing protein [Planococcus sp. ISL-109]|uniref:DUF4181 domain-containing protein n=1 Tax=Planococcus sp. ISL-109 TaxID=2819166 RepID=UPI001BE51FDF|nr:DUF4181 domain-containing protein [Planococcus sp. ISL-109]MBT2583296.1 DUF4181 domain-containing protein [Planococcus sp. ISL-109]